MHSTFFNVGKLLFLRKEERKTDPRWQVFPLYLNVPALPGALSGVKSEATEEREEHTLSPPPPTLQLVLHPQHGLLLGD